MANGATPIVYVPKCKFMRPDGNIPLLLVRSTAHNYPNVRGNTYFQRYTNGTICTEIGLSICPQPGHPVVRLTVCPIATR